jgi:hypothetical protein
MYFVNNVSLLVLIIAFIYASVMVMYCKVLYFRGPKSSRICPFRNSRPLNLANGLAKQQINSRLRSQRHHNKCK